MYSFMFIHFHFFIYVVNCPVLSHDLRLLGAPPSTPKEAAIDFEFAGCFVGEKDVFYQETPSNVDIYNHTSILYIWYIASEWCISKVVYMCDMWIFIHRYSFNLITCYALCVWGDMPRIGRGHLFGWPHPLCQGLPTLESWTSGKSERCFDTDIFLIPNWWGISRPHQISKKSRRLADASSGDCAALADRIRTGRAKYSDGVPELVTTASQPYTILHSVYTYIYIYIYRTTIYIYIYTWYVYIFLHTHTVYVYII